MCVHMYLWCVCVCMCVRECVCVCMCERARVGVFACVCVHMRMHVHGCLCMCVTEWMFSAKKSTARAEGFHDCELSIQCFNTQGQTTVYIYIQNGCWPLFSTDQALQAGRQLA